MVLIGTHNNGGAQPFGGGFPCFVKIIWREINPEKIMASAERVYRRDATPRTVDAQATANQRGFSTLHTTERITAAKHETAISLDC